MKNFKTNTLNIFGRAVLFGPLLTLSVASGISTAQNLLPLMPPTVSTVPSNGDLNPYGVAFAPKSMVSGYTLQPGDLLVSNFNNAANLQGLGATIVRIDTAGNASTFFTSQAPQTGMTAALGVLSNGIVLAGNLPTLDGTAATAGRGRLAVLDGFGNFLGTFGTSATVSGPWGMAIADSWNGTNGTAHAFVSNVLNGTISRFDISYTRNSLSAGVIILASGFNHRLDPAALTLGPSGVAYDSVHDVLYAANSDDNSIYEIQHAVAATATTSASLLVQDLTHLHGPVGLTLLPNGHLLVANSDGSNADSNQSSELVEYASTGQFLTEMAIDKNNGGAFGLAAVNVGWGTVRMGAVDDNANNIQIRTAVIQ